MTPVLTGPLDPNITIAVVAGLALLVAIAHHLTRNPRPPVDPRNPTPVRPRTQSSFSPIRDNGRDGPNPSLRIT